MATKFNNLRTGDVVKIANDGETTNDHKWGVLLNDKSFCPKYNRIEARNERQEFSETVEHSRLAKILKVTPKTVTVEISK